VGRNTISSLKKIKRFYGNEQLLVPNRSLATLVNYTVPKTQTIIGPPLIHKTSLPSGFITLPIGSIHSKEYLYNKGFHTNQQSALVTHKINAVSIIFGEEDTFGPQIRLWDANNNDLYERALQRAGFLSSSINIYINLKTCKHTLDIHQTTRTQQLCWKVCSTDYNCKTTKYILYAGIMYVVSYVYKDSRKFYQFAEKPAPDAWHKSVFTTNK